MRLLSLNAEGRDLATLEQLSRTKDQVMLVLLRATLGSEAPPLATEAARRAALDTALRLDPRRLSARRFGSFDAG